MRGAGPDAARGTTRRRPAAAAGSSRKGELHPESSRRVALMASILVLLLGAMGVRLVQLQISQGPQLASAAISQQVQQVSIPATRGLILASNGEVLAGNVEVYNIFADPEQIPRSQKLREAARLSPVLGESVDSLLRLLQQPLEFVYLAQNQSQAVQQKLEAMNLTGIGALEHEGRSYGPGPVKGTTLGSDVLGFVDAQGVGQYGLEGYYNSVLAGHAGEESVVHDLQGNAVVLSGAPDKAAQNGRTLQTSINPTIQWDTEQDLANEVAKVHATSGTMIVMNVRTGGIVAWADAPSYNANDYASEPVKLLKDQGVSDIYEPGSVMKVVTFAGALQNGVITPTTKIYDPGTVTVQGETIPDWDNGAYQGTVTTQWVLEDSLNVGAVHIEQMEGAQKFYRNMENFGFGKPTGIDLAGEASPYLPPLSQLQPVQLATAAFGQGIVTSPIGMLTAINTVANGGVWIQPHVVTSISGGGKPTTYIHPKTRRVISAATAATLSHMMVGVVDGQGASGFEARIWPSWKGEIAGKTGTASLVVDGTYGYYTIDSFTEFFPASDPEYSMICIIRKPHVPPVLMEGAYDAAPTSKLVAEALIDQFKLQP